jgi:hypothetical protein
MPERSFDHLTAYSRQQFAAFALGSPRRCVHNLHISGVFAGPSSLCRPLSPGDVRVHTELSSERRNLRRVIALIRNDRLDFALASRFLEIHRCIDHRCRVSGIPRVHRCGDDPIALQFRRVPCLVGHPRRAVRHPRDTSVSIMWVLPVAVRALYSCPFLVYLPEPCISRIVEASPPGQLVRVVLPALARVLADDRLHRSIRVGPGLVGAKLLSPGQAFPGRHAEHESKDLVEHDLRQPLARLADRRVVGGFLLRPQSEELRQPPGVGASPRDAAVRRQPLEAPHERHPTEDTRRNRRTAHHSGVTRGVQSLDNGVELVSVRSRFNAMHNGCPGNCGRAGAETLTVSKAASFDLNRRLENTN